VAVGRGVCPRCPPLPGARASLGGANPFSCPLPYALMERIFPFIRMSGLPIRWYFPDRVRNGDPGRDGSDGTAGAVRWKVLRPNSRQAPRGGEPGRRLVELAPRWIETRRVQQPGFVADLRQEAGDFVIYDLGRPGEALLRQIGHGRPLIGGYISRVTREAREFLKGTPVLRALRGELDLPPDEILREAHRLKLRFLIIPADHGATRKMPERGLALRWQEAGLQVWSVPE